MSEEVKALLLDARRVRPEYGPKKLIPMLQRAYPALSFPSKSAVTALYKREGLVATQKKRHRPTHYKSSDMGYYGPNALWCTDFKGDMFFGNKRRSAPLTVCDGVGRFLLGCYDLELKRCCDVKTRFTRLFREFGIPDGILSDNGPPFASVKSTKQFPRILEDPQYPDADFLERLDDRGRLWWKGGKHYLAKALERELVGIKHLGCDWVQIQFGPVVLGEIKKGKFLPKQPIARKHR
ncbi:MAG: hypothetical protein JKY56_07880 [Kofleriaceae bacterium]|nr:hypothetical protein [Kofleriaceae bacterium]